MRSRIHRGSTDDGSLRNAVTIAIAIVSSAILVVSLAGCTGSDGSGASDSAAAPIPTQPPRTTSVPAPDDTTIDNVIPDAPTAPEQQAQLDDIVTLDTGVQVTVVELTGVTVEEQTPGEVAGPAVAAKVRFENGSGAPLDLSTAMISLVDAAGNVATPTTSQPAAPITGTLDQGGTAEGTYVFRIPEDTRGDITLMVDYAAGAPVVVFHGSVT